MPGVRKATKLSAQKEGELRLRVLDVLNNSDEALTTDQIKQRDLCLAGYSPQKLSRVLGYLHEMGFVKKAKSKSLNRMVYKAVSKMREQGYEVEEAYGIPKPYTGVDWELEEELNNKEDEEEYDNT